MGQHGLTTPSLSIVTVTLNSGRHVRRAIESVLSQVNDRLQYIVIDGQSTDDTVAIVESYRPVLGDRLVVVSEKDGGLYDAMNKGIALATGDVIGILNSDDQYMPGALRAVELAFEAQEADIVFGDVAMVDSAESWIHRAIVSGMRDRMTLDHPGCFVRRTAYQRWGGFDARYSFAADYDFLLRCLLGGARFVRVDQVVARFEYGGASSGSFDTRRREVYDIQSRQLGRAHAQWCQLKLMTGVRLSAVRRTLGTAILGRERYERIRLQWRRASSD